MTDEDGSASLLAYVDILQAFTVPSELVVPPAPCPFRVSPASYDMFEPASRRRVVFGCHIPTQILPDLSIKDDL